jgi:hypothetical protein
MQADGKPLGARNLLNGAWQGVGTIRVRDFPLQRDNHLQVHVIREWVVESQIESIVAPKQIGDLG